MTRFLMVTLTLVVATPAEADGSITPKNWHELCKWRLLAQNDASKLTSTRWCFGVPFATLKSGYKAELVFGADGRFNRLSNLKLKGEGEGRWKTKEGIIQLSLGGKRLKTHFCSGNLAKISNQSGRPFEAIVIDGSPYFACGSLTDGGL